MHMRSEVIKMTKSNKHNNSVIVHIKFTDRNKHLSQLREVEIKQ